MFVSDACVFLCAFINDIMLMLLTVATLLTYAKRRYNNRYSYLLTILKCLDGGGR